MRFGVIINVRSRRNTRLLPALREAMVGRPSVHAVELDGICGLDGALRDLASRGVRLLVIVGGDGTVQAVLTHLLSGDGCGFDEPPKLCVLAGGTTNMTAADVGVRDRPDRALRRLIGLPPDSIDLRATTLDRHVVEVVRGDDPPRFGMFFGTGAICRAIRLARRSVHPMRLGSSAESALTLAGVFGERLFGGGGERDRVMRGDDIAIARNDGPSVPATTLLALCTTLDRLILRSRPFWGDEPGTLRCTRIRYPAPRFWRSVPRIMYGRKGRDLGAPAYASCNADSIRLEMDCPFTIDGELFESSRTMPIVLRGDRRVRFVRF